MLNNIGLPGFIFAMTGGAGEPTTMLNVLLANFAVLAVFPVQWIGFLGSF